MSLRSSLALFKVPFFAPAVLALLASTLAEAIAGSYMALLAVQKLGMSALEVGLFLTLSAVSSIAVTTLFGHWHDNRPALWPLIVALLAKVLGYTLCAFVVAPWMLLVIAFAVFGIANSAFPVLFAIAKGYLDREGGDVPARGMAVLRLASSLSWAIGPALGALFVAYWGFEGVFLGATVLSLVAIATVLVSRIAPQPLSSVARPRVTLAVAWLAAPAVAALTFFHWSMFMGSTATSITVVTRLGTETDVGLLFSLCAALEVVVMGVFVLRPAWGTSRTLLVAGFVIFSAYFALLYVMPSLAAIYWGQVLRAVAIAIISVVGMAYLQRMLPGRAGVASALFGNTSSMGFLLSGIGTGTLAAGLGYTAIFAVCAGLCLVAALVLIGRGRTQPASAA